MSKFTRYTLFAGILAFGLAACGDDVTIVDPPPTPNPPLVVSMTPANVSIDIGNTVDLAVARSGGDPDATASWTCTSSNNNIATATGTATGCRVQGQAAGTVTITALVTKGTESQPAASEVTVLPDTSVPASVSIHSVTQGSFQTPVTLNNVRRQVEVTVNVNPGTQIISAVVLNFRGQEIARHTLTPAQVAEMQAALAEDPDSPAAQAITNISFSWETDRYTIDSPVTGASVATPSFLNGPGALTASVAVSGGSQAGTAVSSSPLDLTLRNLNGFHLKIDRTGSLNTANDVQGFQWRGGRDGTSVGAGIEAHLVPVIYTAGGLTLASAQFSFASMVRGIGADHTYTWTNANLSAYTMPLSTAAFPNQLRDGEYPRLVGNPSLSDGQGMGPFGGALDCVGNPTGILNVEVLTTQVTCPDGAPWSPPSATRRADASEVLDPLRVGERIDNGGPTGRTYTLSSVPGTPNRPQVPNPGGLVSPAGVWINGGYQFSNSIGGTLVDSGVSRVGPAGTPAPTFLARIYEGSADGGTTWADMTANPSGAFFAESVTWDPYRARVIERDALDNRTTWNLLGAGAGIVNFGQESGRPILAHNVGSAADRWAFDMATAGADDPANTFYNLNWTDPITTAASGFTAFGPNPIWRQIHRIHPGGPTPAIGGAGSALNATNYAAGPSLQNVTGGATDDGYYAWRAYVLDDAGNLGVDVSDNDLPMHRQVAIASEQPTVFGITAPVNMPGGQTVTFQSNASHNFDLGSGFLSLDYTTFLAPGYWAIANGVAPNTAGGYYTPASTLAPTQGTTGGVRHQMADFNLGKIFNSPLEEVATLLTASPISRGVPGFIRSIEWLCLAAGVPHADCPAAPADWADIEANLRENAVGGGTAVGWLSDAGAAADAAYAGNRPNLASFAVYDASRWDTRTDAFSGNVNDVLEQVGPTDALSPFPNRSVSTAPINPVSVQLAANSPYAGTPHQFAWAISNVGGRNWGANQQVTLNVTARLVTSSSAVVGGPGQNLFPGPLGRVDFFVLEPATGTLRWAGAQNNPVLNEGNPQCVGGANQADYRCWDFTANLTLPNFVGGSGQDVQILAVGVNANGDGLATFPVEVQGF